MAHYSLTYQADPDFDVEAVTKAIAALGGVVKKSKRLQDRGKSTMRSIPMRRMKPDQWWTVTITCAYCGSAPTKPCIDKRTKQPHPFGSIHVQRLWERRGVPFCTEEKHTDPHYGCRYGNQRSDRLPCTPEKHVIPHSSRCPKANRVGRPKVIYPALWRKPGPKDGITRIQDGQGRLWDHNARFDLWVCLDPGYRGGPLSFSKVLRSFHPVRQADPLT
jgi:hypothetical protein